MEILILSLRELSLFITMNTRLILKMKHRVSVITGLPSVLISTFLTASQDTHMLDPSSSRIVTEKPLMRIKWKKQKLIKRVSGG